MTTAERQAILTIALAAAFADGTTGERERGEVRRAAESLALGPEINPAALVQDVLLKRVSLPQLAAQLGSPELRQLAFELALGVCDADGLRNEAETRFLAELGGALGLTQPQMAEPAAVADALVTVPLAAAPAANEAELDRLILNAAILNGALELLPQAMASLAILPLQMRLVYRIGQAHGYELDRGHVKDFLAAAGVGLTGQYLEELGRKLVGGLFGAAAGRLVGSLARGATGMAFSFATTYALGHVAKRYYAGGRTMTAQMLQDAFADLLGKAKTVQAQVQPQIEDRARTIDVNRLVQLVRES
jgi:uncharacterized protein (DUF697 family)/tellurite resistance protein